MATFYTTEEMGDRFTGDCIDAIYQSVGKVMANWETEIGEPHTERRDEVTILLSAAMLQCATAMAIGAVGGDIEAVADKVYDAVCQTMDEQLNLIKKGF